MSPFMDPQWRTLGQRRLRAHLRREMPMTSRMWKNRPWTVKIRIGPSFYSRNTIRGQLDEIWEACASGWVSITEANRVAAKLRELPEGLP